MPDVRGVTDRTCRSTRGWAQSGESLIEHRDEEVDDSRMDARASAGHAVEASDHDRSNCLDFVFGPHADRVALQDVLLEAFVRLWRDPDCLKRTEAEIDAVDRRVVSERIDRGS
jgi:hypothetical protein